MPLSYPPKRPKIKISAKAGNLFNMLLAYIRPETLLAVLILTAIVFSFFGIPANGFYIIFGIFLVGYFAERAIKALKRRPLIRDLEEVKFKKTKEKNKK